MKFISQSIFSGFLIFLIFLTTALFAVSIAHAQAVIDTGTAPLPGETQAQTQARLQAALSQVELEQQQAENTLANTKAQSASLSRDIAVLDGQIKVAELNIKAKNLLIATLGKNIDQKQATIDDLNAQIDSGRQTLAELMKKTNELGATSLPEIVLSQRRLTDIYSDLDTFSAVESAMKTTFEQIRSTTAQTQTQKAALTTQQNQQIDAKAAILQDEKKIQLAESQKQNLLSVSKGNEKAYAQVLAQKKAAAASIRAALFALAGGASPIPFGQALQYANTSSKATGVGAAFLLAIMTQESSLGANVGNCYVTNLQTGSGSNAKTGALVTKVMNPTRDATPFSNITGALGLDPTRTVVSCPQSVGWGGAMGPAQFIPSTWLLFQSRIAAGLGKSVSLVSPWNPQDAFMASALYLGDLGASSGSYTSEKNAACKYYSGKSCSYSSLVNSYGVSVMNHANDIQNNMIDPLQGV